MVIREQRQSLQEFRRHAVLITHRSGCLKRPASREDGELTEQMLLRRR